MHIPLPERVGKEKISSFSELLNELLEIELLMDSTEQQRQRPKEKEKSKRFYSGRKKRHTFKAQVVVDKKEGLILNVSCGFAGRVHDLSVFESSGVAKKFIGKVTVWTDKGYKGIEKIVPEWRIKQPKKKLRGKDLSDDFRIIKLLSNKMII